MSRYGEYLRKTIVWGLAAYIFFVSILFTTRTENTVVVKAVLSQAMIFGLGLLWLARLVEERRFALKPAGFNLPLLALLWGCIVSALLATFQYYAIEELARFLAYFLSVWLIYNNVRTRFDCMVLIWALIAATAWATIYALMQAIGADPIDWGQTVFLSTFGNANFFSAYLMSALPVVLGLAFAIRSWYWRFGLGLLYLAGCWCLLFAKTRSSWLGYLGSVLMLGITYFLLTGAIRYLRSHTQHVMAIAIIALVLVGGLVIYMATSEYAYLEEFTSIFKVSYGIEGGTNQVRLVMWMGAGKMWAEHPWLGQGLGSFQLAFPRFRPSYYHLWGVSHNTRHAHNEYLEVLSEQGIIGNILFGWWWWTVFWLGLRSVRTVTAPFWRHLLISLNCGWFAHMIDNVASPHLRWAGTAVAAYFVVGLIFTVIRLDREERTAGPARVRALPATLNPSPLKPVLYLGFMILFAVIAWQEWLIYDGDTKLKLGESYLRLAGERPDQARRDYWDQAFTYFREAIRLNPYDHSAWYKSAFLNLQSGKLQDAMDDYRHLLTIAPNYAQIHYNLGLSYQALGQPYDAIREFLLATRIEFNQHNIKLCEEFLKKPPIDDPMRALAYQVKLAQLSLDEWMVDFHNYLYWTRYRSPNAQGQDAVTGLVDRAKYSYAFSSRGRTWHDLGDRRKKNYYFTRALLWNPRDYEVLWAQQEDYAAAGDADRMGAVLSQIITTVTPAEINGDRRVNEIARMAVEKLSRHAGANERNSQYWDLLGLGLFKTGEFEKAGSCFQKALSIDSNNQFVAQHLNELRAVMQYLEQQRGGRPASAPTPLRPLPDRSTGMGGPMLDDQGLNRPSGSTLFR